MWGVIDFVFCFNNLLFHQTVRCVFDLIESFEDEKMLHNYGVETLTESYAAKNTKIQKYQLTKKC